jgi:hypothetical protein
MVPQFAEGADSTKDSLLLRAQTAADAEEWMSFIGIAKNQTAPVDVANPAAAAADDDGGGGGPVPADEVGLGPPPDEVGLGPPPKGLGPALQPEPEPQPQPAAAKAGTAGFDF